MHSSFRKGGLRGGGGVHSLIHTLKSGLEARWGGSPGEHIGSRIDPTHASGLTSSQTPPQVRFLNLFSWILIVCVRPPPSPFPPPSPGFKTTSRIRHRWHKGSQAGTGRHPKMRRGERIRDPLCHVCVAKSAPQTSESEACIYTYIDDKDARAYKGCELAAELRRTGNTGAHPEAHLHFDWFVSLKLKENPSKKDRRI